MWLYYSYEHCYMLDFFPKRKVQLIGWIIAVTEIVIKENEVNLCRFFKHIC